MTSDARVASSTRPATIVPRTPMFPDGSATFMSLGLLWATFPVTKRKTPLATVAPIFPALVEGS